MKLCGKIQKTDDEQRLVFGWASVAEVGGKKVVDSQGDVVPLAEIERAAYEFVEFYREGGEMHERTGVARLVESCVFTPEKLAAMGFSGDKFGFWVGFRVTDDVVWQKVKDGRYSMFSIGGRAVREEITNE